MLRPYQPVASTHVQHSHRVASGAGARVKDLATEAQPTGHLLSMSPPFQTQFMCLPEIRIAVPHCLPVKYGAGELVALGS